MVLQSTVRNLFAVDKYRGLRIDRYAVVSRDMALLRFWIQCCKDALRMKHTEGYSPTNFNMGDFDFAVERGYVEALAEMIGSSGAEFPLDALIKKTGREETTKPTYYQGLSIGGKRMTGWARERGGQRSYRSAIHESMPPLLLAANRGNLATVEWFLSDTPLRLYKEWYEKNKDEPRLRKLAEAPGGFESSVGQWLKQRSEFGPIRCIEMMGVDNNCLGQLALHGAVMFQGEHEKSLEVIKYLIAVMPDAIDFPSLRDRLTPLALAFINGRVDAARALVEAGADQTTRDAKGKNLLHLALFNASKFQEVDMKKFKELIGLIDRRLIASLLTERCQDGPGGLSPLAAWLTRGSSRMPHCHALRANRPAEIFDFLLQFDGGEAMAMMDSSGQFPLHLAVKASHAAMVEAMLEHDPALLFRENAMGQTALELAHSMYVGVCTQDKPGIGSNTYKPLDRREPEDFDRDDSVLEQDQGRDSGWKTSITRTWNVCKKFAEQEPRDRKLVSVNEAREVAKRLAEKKKQRNERLAEMHSQAAETEDDGKAKKVEDHNDEVSSWLGETWGMYP